MRPALSLWTTFSHFARCAAGSARFGFSSTRPAFVLRGAVAIRAVLADVAPCSAANSSGDGVQAASDAAAIAAERRRDATL